MIKKEVDNGEDKGNTKQLYKDGWKIWMSTNY